MKEIIALLLIVSFIVIIKEFIQEHSYKNYKDKKENNKQEEK